MQREEVLVDPVDYRVEPLVCTIDGEPGIGRPRCQHAEIGEEIPGKFFAQKRLISVHRVEVQLMNPVEVMLCGKLDAVGFLWKVTVGSPLETDLNILPHFSRMLKSCG